MPVVEEVDSPRRLIYAAIGSTKWLTLPEGGHGKPDILGKLSIVAHGLLAGGPIELAALRGGALGLIEVVQAVDQYATTSATLASR